MCIRDRAHVGPDYWYGDGDIVLAEGELVIFPDDTRLAAKAVSYTHLDVYKRQYIMCDLDFFIPVGDSVINHKGIFFVFMDGHLPYLRNFEILMSGSKSRITDIWLLRSANRLYT